MCMRPAHHWGGFAAGAALAMYAHQPLWVAAPSAAVASLTAGGRFSPDADQYKAWKLFDKYTPDELLGRGGPLQHRGITHWWLIPAAVGAGLYVAGGGAWWVWWAWVLLAGWVSHLLLDFVFGQADPWGIAAPVSLSGRGGGTSASGSTLAAGLNDAPSFRCWRWRGLRSWRGRTWAAGPDGDDRMGGHEMTPQPIAEPAGGPSSARVETCKACGQRITRPDVERGRWRHDDRSVTHPEAPDRAGLLKEDE
jgi:hypothetical protein